MIIGYWNVYFNPWLVGFVFPAFGALLALWSITQRRWLALLPGGVLLLINPMLVQLPYSWLITNDIVIISLFVPLSVLIGGGLSLFRDWLMVRLSLFWRALVLQGGAVALAGLALWGAGNLHGVINSATLFVTRADLTAINWVEENTPADARFLINTAPWLPAANRGIDGGWWLLTLANRWISTPPVLYTYGEPDYVSRVQELNREVAGFQPGKEEELYRLIDREQITHIYTTTWSGPLKSATFADSNAFAKIYDRDGVSIFAVYDRAQAEEQQ
ncbi:MAG: hypothetical protein MI924_09600 [Chloroflexales bacterium]|nr:hypothetical protein [Chloroflexales bacterium]